MEAKIFGLSTFHLV